MTKLLLENFNCPECQCSGEFYVDVLATVQLTDTEVSVVGNYFADDYLACKCRSCDYEGRVFEFVKAAEVHS